MNAAMSRTVGLATEEIAQECVDVGGIVRRSPQREFIRDSLGGCRRGIEQVFLPAALEHPDLEETLDTDDRRHHDRDEQSQADAQG